MIPAEPLWFPRVVCFAKYSILSPAFELRGPPHREREKLSVTLNKGM